MYEDFLLQVNKPGRYIGREWNVSKKDFDKSYIKFALCFPDLYEIGMSNLGVRIIYGVLNSIDDICCERFFSADTDMAALLADKGLKLFSLESRKVLAEFDIAGFCLSSELNYTNVLGILDQSGIPFKAKERSNEFPLIIGGGPCTMNPEPMYEFFDLFIIGEAEEAIVELINIYREFKDEYKSSRMNKQELLRKFCRIEGVYVPSFYNVIYDALGRLECFEPVNEDAPFKIKKIFVKDLNASFFPKKWLIPYIQIVHDRLSLEVMRGCPNRCRFCQARVQYFPFRKKDKKTILGLAEDLYAHTGYEEVSLLGLSVSDYPDIEELTQGLVDLLKGKAVSVSLPSIKAKLLVGRLSSLISKIKKTSLTFAPEAGSKKLRDIIAKDFNEEEFFRVIEEAYSLGYLHVKLYFMLGFPFERKEDLDAIIEMAEKVSILRKKLNKSAARVNISINTLIPKPHTALQWFKMEDLESIKEKQDYLKKKAKNRKLFLKFHDLKMSFLEAVLCLGDRRLSEVILCAYKRGARFDAWENRFEFEKWTEAFKETGIDPHFYLREKERQELFPWDFIDTGITKKALLSEFDDNIP
ncbi:MAG: TIGR03960 family B12-binding radical SAM protein [Candidatus Omnitrophica bacterium]|nr:TIGR03960 family B12-binding radical SAM protein [Candidatus Omnitrophota bacterium]